MSHAITAEFNVPAAMRDGTVLRANIFRPAETGSYPVALTRTPYGKDFFTTSIYLDAVRLARAGYLVVIQDVRGRFASEGEWRPFAFEGVDGCDSVEWAASLPGSNGNVGMWGMSYVGLTQWMAAMQSPPHLKALVPSITWADARDGVQWRGGALELGSMANWGLGTGFDDLFKRHAAAPPAELGRHLNALVGEINALPTEGYRALPLNDFAPFRRLGIGDMFFDLVPHPFSRDLTAPYSVATAYNQVKVPALNVGGWYDIFAQGTIQNFVALRTAGSTEAARQSRLVIGPWSHMNQSHVVGELDFGFKAQMGWIDLQYDMTALTQRWFDYWLKGIENGVTSDPPIKLFVMGENVWRDEQEWPLARTQYTPYYLHSGGMLTPQPPGAADPADHYAYDPEQPVPTRGGAILMNRVFGDAATDQRPIEARPDVLLYTTEALAHDTEVTGPITVRLWAVSDAPDTDFVARLVDVHPDGFAQPLTDGIIRARYRDGDVPALIEPGRPYCYTIDLWSTANVFGAGHRIRLHVTSSSFPRWDRNLNTGAPFGTDSQPRVAHQTILHDAAHPSQVILPIIPR
jgi:hypothetical protein